MTKFNPSVQLQTNVNKEDFPTDENAKISMASKSLLKDSAAIVCLFEAPLLSLAFTMVGHAIVHCRFCI